MWKNETYELARGVWHVSSSCRNRIPATSISMSSCQKEPVFMYLAWLFLSDPHYFWRIRVCLGIHSYRVYHVSIFLILNVAILFMYIARKKEMCIMRKKNLIEFFDVHGLWAAVLGINEFYTTGSANLHVKCTKRSHQKGPNYENDDELIIQSFRLHFHS